MPWVIGIGLALSLAVITLIVGFLDNRIDELTAQMALTGALVLVSYAYASLILLKFYEDRELNIRPVVSLDLIAIGNDTLAGVGVRVRNCGKGPALNIRFKLKHEPLSPAFKISGMRALKEGIPVLDSGEYRVISTGQPYSTLTQMDDGYYEATVFYESIYGEPYDTDFTLRPQRDLHLLRSSIPFHDTE